MSTEYSIPQGVNQRWQIILIEWVTHEILICKKAKESLAFNDTSLPSWASHLTTVGHRFNNFKAKSLKKQKGPNLYLRPILPTIVTGLLKKDLHFYFGPNISGKSEIKVLTLNISTEWYRELTNLLVGHSNTGDGLVICHSWCRPGVSKLRPPRAFCATRQHF